MVTLDTEWVQSLDQQVNQCPEAGQHPQWVLEQVIEHLYTMAKEVGKEG